MRISIAATNPCHLFPFARELAQREELGCYYSGYPKWKLGESQRMPLRTHAFRTNVVYGLLKFAPSKFLPNTRDLFLWQDHGFDRWVGKHLEQCDFIHAMPGQCLQTFRTARERGIATVMNHATGPVREWVRIMEPEYARVGLRLAEVCPYDDAYFAREEEEYALSDWHCVASSVVRNQLITMGVAADRIWTVPYGADGAFSHGSDQIPDGFRVVFAGQVGLRKGVKTLLDALEKAKSPRWKVDFFGAVLPEAREDIACYKGSTPLSFHGAVSQSALAERFRTGSVLVLPSLEEGFGLVVPQALACGMPVILSDRVGAKDLITHRHNGSVVPVGDSEALAAELRWWEENPRRVHSDVGWRGPTEQLLRQSRAALCL